jgi:hypothetical protein
MEVLAHRDRKANRVCKECKGYPEMMERRGFREYKASPVMTVHPVRRGIREYKAYPVTMVLRVFKAFLAMTVHPVLKEIKGCKVFRVYPVITVLKASPATMGRRVVMERQFSMAQARQRAGLELMVTFTSTQPLMQSTARRRLVSGVLLLR